MTRQTFSCRACHVELGIVRPSGDLELSEHVEQVKRAGNGWVLICSCGCPMAWNVGAAIHWRRPAKEVA